MKFKIRQIPYLLTFLGIFSAFIPDNSTPLLALENIMDINEITPGMKGYGKTVFTGDRIEIFNVEVLGILKNWEAKSNMILIKMSGGPLENSGIIAGMSGSPVYINNRLIGAVAYGWSFAKEAIAGVTPINEMKDTLLNIQTQKSGTSLTSNEWELPSSSQNETESTSQVTSLMPQEAISQGLNNIRLTPILSPLIVSGVDSRVLQKMQTLFNTYGLYPLQGGSYLSPANPLLEKETRISENTKLVPGASIAAILIKGDLSAAVVGTVTYKDGDTVLAFGHPFLQTGNADLPMASAYVYAILSSLSNSVKMASPLEIVGRINQDRRSGIAGTLGESSHMVPCQIEVEGTQKLKYNFEVVDNKLLTPSLVLMAAHSAVLSTEKMLGEKSVNIKLSAQIEGYEKPVVIENVFYELDQSWFSLNHIIQPFAMIVNNQFQKVRMKQIDLKIKVLDMRQTAYIEAIKVNKKQVRPGDTLQVDVRLKPFAGESFYQTVLMQIPEDVLPGSVLNVTACDAIYGQALNMGRSAGKYLPTNFEQLLHYIENMERNNNLMIRILLQKRGLTYKGEGFPSLPTSMLSIMSFSNQSGIGPLFDEVISRIPTTYVLSGNQTIPISVK
ncbi:MAG TPA: SpoIVB peptidase S55 domain-containing protein [Thermodesulfovibrionia bacterium]|nr:SpoIVB peptidase S55 domain-containing protein [Thermodesulfovibrionia bacterium]